MTKQRSLWIESNPPNVNIYARDVEDTTSLLHRRIGQTPFRWTPVNGMYCLLVQAGPPEQFGRSFADYCIVNDTAVIVDFRQPVDRLKLTLPKSDRPGWRAEYFNGTDSVVFRNLTAQQEDHVPNAH